MVNTILAKRVNHIVAKGDHPVWPKGAKSHGFSTPYGLPLSLIRSNRRTFYFHCADEGDKLDCIRANPVVSLSAVSRCTPKFEAEKKNFTMYYDSAIALGEAEIVTDNSEKIMALRLLCQRFLPKHMENFEEAIKRSLERTVVVKITLTEPSVGKSKP